MIWYEPNKSIQTTRAKTRESRPGNETGYVYIAINYRRLKPPTLVELKAPLVCMFPTESKV